MTASEINTESLNSLYHIDSTNIEHTEDEETQYVGDFIYGMCEAFTEEFNPIDPNDTFSYLYNERRDSYDRIIVWNKHIHKYVRLLKIDEEDVFVDNNTINKVVDKIKAIVNETAINALGLSVEDFEENNDGNIQLPFQMTEYYYELFSRVLHVIKKAILFEYYRCNVITDFYDYLRTHAYDNFGDVLAPCAFDDALAPCDCYIELEDDDEDVENGFMESLELDANAGKSYAVYDEIRTMNNRLPESGTHQSIEIYDDDSDSCSHSLSSDNDRMDDTGEDEEDSSNSEDFYEERRIS